ncbi:MAG TPA: primosomal protein N' [Myxococcota bacterium]
MSATSDSLFRLDAPRVARVALPVPVNSLFDYALPEALASDARVGCRVRVPIRTRRETGIIVELADAPERADLALSAVEAVLDAEPALPAALLAAIREEAHAALCPIGIALHAALPPGASPRAERALALTPRGREALRSGALRGEAASWLAHLEPAPRSAAWLARRGAPAAQLAELERDGLVQRALLERAGVQPARVRRARLPAGVSLEQACAGPLARAPKQAALLREIAEAGAAGAPLEALTAREPKRAAQLRALVARGLVAIESSAAVLGEAGAERATPHALTREQAHAHDSIAAALRARRHDSFLLHGVTGSGKTEVYLRLVADALALGRSALVLVPEITLTHQMVSRLRARFADRVAVLHSGLSAGERVAQWNQLRSGAVPIAVGARSALFAPLRDVGVIVIDEEHDGAYKSEEGFRFHARSLAARRARAEGCPLVLGSATPALETRYAAERGALLRLRMQDRPSGRPLPAVELVDLVKERASLPRGARRTLSPTLARALRETLADGAQAILFLNRRGFSSQIACVDCQDVSRCLHCDISLTYHAAANALRCHYCDYQVRPPTKCAACGSERLALLGTGTERVEEEVRAAFPDARIARLDRDTAGRRGAVERVLAELRAGAKNVLIGTQMVAKGHDFPGVRLVGVLNADLGLHLPDFRAAERTFQLLTQVAGRAGRGAEPGRVVIQTFAPGHYAIRPVALHDYESFYADEIRHREALGYPPFGRLALVRVSALEAVAAREAALALALAGREASAANGQGVEVLGPAEAPIARLRNRYRQQILLKHPEAGAVWRVAERIANAAEGLPSAVRATLDVNPMDML